MPQDTKNLKAPAKLRLRVSPTAEALIRRGHPWLFAASVREQNREGTLGELAIIYDRNDAFLAIGLFDPDSPIRVRIVHAGKPIAIDEQWWRQNLRAALDRRKNLFGPETTGFRCINGESDFWPALVVDRYDTTLVLKIYSGIWLQRLPAIVTLLQEQLPNERIVLRLSRNIQALASRSGWTDGQIVSGLPVAETVIFRENDLQFEAEVLRGQKTGFFLDQRENRRMIESFACGRSVLNAFSFSGGFSLYAARGGAISVTDLDISAHALASAERNFALNQSIPSVAKCCREGIQADVFRWLRENRASHYDLIILDPPSLAKRETERADAIHAYEALAFGGINHLNRAGILVAASCSAHVSAEEFFGSVRSAARKSGRQFLEMQTTRHAPDHPARFKESEYLKCIYLQFK